MPVTPAKRAMAYAAHVSEWNIELQRDIDYRIKTLLFSEYQCLKAQYYPHVTPHLM
jgi:hypothetical protein